MDEIKCENMTESSLKNLGFHLRAMNAVGAISKLLA